MPAGIQKDMNGVRSIAGQNDRFLAHTRDKIIARVRNLALMPDEQPDASKDLLLFLLVNVLGHKNITADHTLF